ncbi:hypothetical protein BaRGS_00019144 [Batillaria attramentaria]|uniref:Uncharacterized protein n=1 Tax=Batillaria attramentaria TaxID=370345 RepID=A0ABD0KRC3_9CAEN
MPSGQMRLYAHEVVSPTLWSAPPCPSEPSDAGNSEASTLPRGRLPVRASRPLSDLFAAGDNVLSAGDNSPQGSRSLINTICQHNAGTENTLRQNVYLGGSTKK